MILSALLILVAAAADAGACSVSSATEARFSGIGYNHVVILNNACDKPQICSVFTDVNPQAQSVEVPAKARIEVVTFLGSPATAFKATVSCRAR